MLTFVDYGETFVFLVLLMFSIVAFAVIIERYIVFRNNTNKNTIQIFKDIVACIRNHNTAKHFELPQDNNIYSDFANFSMTYFNKKHDGLPDLMQSKMIEEKLGLEKRLSILNTLGNNAPFIGLLGTVLGVIKAFHGLGTLGSTGADVVMRSISKALLATAAGLFIAIPVVMANNYFTRKMKIMIQNLEILSKEFIASMSLKNQKVKKPVKTELTHR